MQMFRRYLRQALRLCAASALVMLMAVGSAQMALAAKPPAPSPKPDGHVRVNDAIANKYVRAKSLFIQARSAAAMPASAIGKYNRGCLAGAEQIPKDGSAWQAMRLSRKRRWGHPKTIELVKRLAIESQTLDGWPGLLVGDISMARGGPMWPSHSSHQIGLDADIWFTPMPDRRLSAKERETMSAVFMLTRNQLSVNREVFGDGQFNLVRRVASYDEVERVLVHPAIKKELCLKAGTDRAWLSKVRPVWGHNYHFHIRLKCPADSPNCRPQSPPRKVDGCGAELSRWYKLLEARLKPKPKPKKKKKRTPRRKRKFITMADLPQQCSTVLAAQDR